MKQREEFEVNLKFFFRKKCPRIFAVRRVGVGVACGKISPGVHARQCQPRLPAALLTGLFGPF